MSGKHHQALLIGAALSLIKVCFDAMQPFLLRLQLLSLRPSILAARHCTLVIFVCFSSGATAAAPPFKKAAQGPSWPAHCIALQTATFSVHFSSLLRRGRPGRLLHQTLACFSLSGMNRRWIFVQLGSLGMELSEGTLQWQVFLPD